MLRGGNVSSDRSNADSRNAATFGPKRKVLNAAAQFVAATLLGVAVLVGCEAYFYTSQGQMLSEVLGSAAPGTEKLFPSP
jgi:hypothetical protein